MLPSGRPAAALRMAVWVSVSLAWAVMTISDGWLASSLTVAAEDRQQLVQPGLHTPEVADVTPMDGIRVVTKVVVGKLLQPFQLGVDGGTAGEVGVEGGWLGVHRGIRDVIDDRDMNALFYREAKLFPSAFDQSTIKLVFLLEIL
jgi:hypothetical protein